MAEGFINTSSDSLLASVGQAPVRETEAQANARLAEQDRKRAERGGDGVPNPLYKPSIPKGAPPVKIDTTTGAGVPGGFDGASLKHPTDETANANASISSITAAQSKLTAAANSPCVLSGKIVIPGLMDAISSLKNQLGTYQTKLNVALKAPNFSKPFTLPTPPRLPAVPKLNLPNIPSDPCIKVPAVPAAPVVPSISSVPKIT
jgi:hypothetical protein